MSLVNPKNQYKKGELILNVAGWPAIVMEATRGNDPTIIPMVEVFGFEHECGSIYTNEVVQRLNKVEFETYLKMTGMIAEKLYFKGKLIERN